MSILDELRKNNISGRKSLAELAREEQAREAFEAAADTAAKEQSDSAAPTDFYKIRLTKNNELSIFDSKLGGSPYWNNAIDYPKDKDGSELMLLCQLNFDKLSLNDERLPSTGILQFFISKNPICSGRVVYHAEINYNTEKADYISMPLSSGFSPVISVAEISLERAETEETADGHKIFGSPAFCQEDPREAMPEEEKEYYNTLLLQIDSDFNSGDPIVIWGDSGVANFFINSEALKRKEFSKTIFNWDCY